MAIAAAVDPTSALPPPPPPPPPLAGRLTGERADVCCFRLSLSAEEDLEDLEEGVTTTALGWAVGGGGRFVAGRSCSAALFEDHALAAASSESSSSSSLPDSLGTGMDVSGTTLGLRLLLALERPPYSSPPLGLPRPLLAATPAAAAPLLDSVELLAAKTSESPSPLPIILPTILSIVSSESSLEDGPGSDSVASGDVSFWCAQNEEGKTTQSIKLTKKSFITFCHVAGRKRGNKMTTSGTFWLSTLSGC